MKVSRPVEEVLQLLDWRRQVWDLYREVRLLHPQDPVRAHARWRKRRDRLVGSHPQSPLAVEARAAFHGLDYFQYDAAFAFAAVIEPTDEDHIEVPTSTGLAIAFTRFGRVTLPVGALDLYWLESYGGGLFVPLRDATAGAETYGGGRYLIDSVKGADLGATGDGELVLDFNFSYNPSCHYRADWTCPLPPSGNWVDTRIEAGERVYHDGL